MTSNQTTQKVFAFQRSAMLTGSPTAKVVYTNFTPPSGGGFFCPMPGDNDGNGGLAPAGTPCPIFTYSDNGWGGGATDAIKIYTMAVNWVPTTATATITLAATLNTSAFDASYDASWNDVSQPGTTQKLDGIGGVIQYRAQWRNWNTYRTTVLNWPVKISATQRSIMWAEVRQDATTGVWSIYQQSIYAPDTKTRWMGSIAMDDNGGIGLCYARASTTAGDYMSLYYAGRKVCDPVNTLPVTEQLAIAGTGAQTGGVNRDGDYAQTTLDPDGITFWHTGEYMGGPTGSTAARTRIYSFQLPTCTPIAPVANFSATPTTICAGSSVTFTDLSVNTPTSWAWTFTGGTPSSSTVQNPVVVYNTPGTYNVTLVSTNASGSSAPVTMTGYIIVKAIPAAPVATNTGPFCAGSTINLFASTVAGATYAWTGPSTFTSAIQNATRPSATTAMAGTYSVTATVLGCTSVVGTTAVVINSLPVITAESNLTYCPGAAVPLNSFVTTPAGATYSWTNSNTAIGLVASGTGSLPAFTATNTTSSAIVAAIAVTPTLSGCVGSISSFTITVNPSPVVTAETSVSVCAGATVPANTFVSTPVGATYTWTNSNTAIGLVASGSTSTPSFTATNAGASPITGTITITPTLGGCAGTTSTYTITVNPIPATPVATNTGPFCPGTTINLLSSTIAGAAYSWTGPSTFTSAIQNATRPSATAAMAGTYSVTATVAGCTSLTGTTVVVISTAPVVTTETNIAACNGAPVPANTFASTPAGATYAWTNSTPSIGLAASGTTSLPSFTATNSAASPVIATITITPTLAGCVGTPLTFTITVNPTPVATFTSSANQCLTGNSFGFTNTGSSGIGFTYSWTFAGGTPASSTTNNPAGETFAASGTHNIIHTITSTAGCIGSTSVLVTVFPSPSALAVTTTSSSCSSPTGTITIGTVTGGTGPYTYSVNGSGYTGTTSYTAIAAGTYPVIVKDVNGCTFTTSAIIGSSSGPTALAVTNTNTTCGNSNGTITIGTVTGGTGPYTYSVNGSGFTSSILYSTLASGTYSIAVQDGGGCVFTTSTTIGNIAGPSALAVTSTNSNCGGSDGTVTIGSVTGGTSTFTYSFDGSSFTSTTGYTGIAAGTYAVVVQDVNGCTYTTSITVGNTGTTPATPTISLVGLTLTSSSVTGNQWYLDGVLIAGATAQTYTATVNGTYTVVLTSGGCASSISTPIVITNVGIDESVNPYLFGIYPNPNDGNFNVTFTSADKSTYKLELFNALGQIIFRDDLVDFKGVYTKKLSVTEYGKGVYTITLTNSKNETVKKVIVY